MNTLGRIIFIFCIFLAVFIGCSKHVPVILISLDTLRPDHLSCYGYKRKTSPCLDEFARINAVLFESAYAQAPYTLPSHMSMLTGLYPEAHGVLSPAVDDPDTGEPRTATLAPSVRTLAQMLRDTGYFTSAFTDGGLVSACYGFDNGFSEYRDERAEEGSCNGFRRFGPDLHAWIREHAKERFFLFIHTFDTHGPYKPPQPFSTRFCDQAPGRGLPEIDLSIPSFLNHHHYQELDRFDSLQEVVDAYDGCIAYADSELGKLFSLLDELGIFDEALVIVTSDHGEAFMENGLTIGHGVFLFNEEVRIPLLIKFPGARHAGKSVGHVVESVDIVPTVLSCLGIPVHEKNTLHGQNLLSGLDENIWEKKHAYGLSPGTGMNRYFIQDDVKYIEGSRDENGSALMRILKPVDPVCYDSPEKPYFLCGQQIYYDLENDPLGILELFSREDRLFDLSRSYLESNAPQLIDRKLFESYCSAADRISADAFAWGEKHGTGLFFKNEIDPEKVKALAGLGYGGIAETGHMSLPRRDVPSRSFPQPPVTDRSLLNAGDLLQRRLFELSENEMPPRGPCMSLYTEALDSYNKFLVQHPDKSVWTAWRVKALDIIINRCASKGGFEISPQ